MYPDAGWQRRVAADIEFKGFPVAGGKHNDAGAETDRLVSPGDTRFERNPAEDVIGAYQPGDGNGCVGIAAALIQHDSGGAVIERLEGGDEVCEKQRAFAIDDAAQSNVDLAAFAEAAVDR